MNKTVFLVWEIEVVTIEKAYVQFQNLRAIASTDEKAKIYKKMFENERKINYIADELGERLWFEIEERELDHAMGFTDSRGFIYKNRVENIDIKMLVLAPMVQQLIIEALVHAKHNTKNRLYSEGYEKALNQYQTLVNAQVKNVEVKKE